MPFEVVLIRTPHYIRFDVAGPPSLKNYFDLIERAAQETLAQRDKLALVDLRGVTGRLSFTDQLFIGDVVGDKLAHLHKVASLVPDNPDSYNSPKVAQRKGVNVRTFGSEHEAIAWLAEVISPPGSA
jgi:hypothetical protein